MILFIVTMIIVLLGMGGLGIGYLLQGRCLRGRCGGEGIIGPDGEILLCNHCPKRKELEEAADAT